MAVTLNVSKPSPRNRARHFDRLASMDAGEIAEHYGCRYHGADDPIEDRGVFFDASRWLSNGVAQAVEFEYDEVADALRVWRGVVHRPNRHTQWRLWRESGSPIDEYTVDDAIVDAIRNFGLDVPSARFPDVLTFKLREWKPGRIWKSVHSWLTELSR